MDDIRMVVGLDFGTTFSGFSHANVQDNKDFIETESNNHDIKTKSWGVSFKTPTVLLYDNDFKEVIDWGRLKVQRAKSNKTNVVDRFKLHLGDLPNDQKPKLPDKLHEDENERHKRAITDYLIKMGEVIRSTCKNIDFDKQILLVMTVPTEYSFDDKQTMRECAYSAKLIDTLDSERLEIITEPEAAALYCFTKNSLRDIFSGDKRGFMVVDCGGGTIDITTQKYINEHQLSEITVKKGGFFGSSFIDQEFLNYLEEIWGGKPTIKKLEESYNAYLYLLKQKFCDDIKSEFTGKDPDFDYELDLSGFRSSFSKIPEINNSMNKTEWNLSIEHKKLKMMFDKYVNQIIEMIHLQLKQSKDKCAAIFLVGGFGESEYLQNRVKEEFGDKYFPVPDPITAVVCGAAIYGLRMNLIKIANMDLSKAKPIIYDRRLKYTYGVKVASFVHGEDNEIDDNEIEHDHRCPYRKFRIAHRFSCIDDARAGTSVKVDQEFSEEYSPLFPWQTAIRIQIYITKERDAKRCDEYGVKELGELEVKLPTPMLMKKPVQFSLTFGKEEIKANAKSLINGEPFDTTFELFKLNIEKRKNKDL